MNFFRRLFLGPDAAELRLRLDSALAMVAALNQSLAYADGLAKQEEAKKLHVFGAIAFQNGGELFLPSYFLDATGDGNHRVGITWDEERDGLSIKVEKEKEGA